MRTNGSCSIITSSQRVAAPAISLDEPPQLRITLLLESHHPTAHGAAQLVQEGGLRWGEGVGVEGAVGRLWREVCEGEGVSG